jgi:O-antigen/teichoic acid export membrane protein
MKQKFAGNVLLKTFNVLLAGFATVCWARIGGVEVFGIVSGFTFATFILAELIDKGNSTAVARTALKEKRVYSQWPSEIPRIITRYTICLIPLFILLVIFPIPNRLTYALLLMNMPFLMINIYFQQFAYGYSKLKQVGAGVIIEKIFWFAAVPISLFNYDPVLTIPISILLGSLAQNIYAVVEIQVSTKSEDFRLSKGFFRIADEGNRPHGNVDISAFRIIGNLFYLDISLISLLAGSTAAGHYAAGARLRSILTIGFTSVSDLVGPKIIDNLDWRSVVIKRDYIVILIVNTIGCIFTFFFAPPLTLFLLGSEFVESIFFVKCFAVTCLILGIVTILRTILVSLFFERFVGRIYILGFLLNICCFPFVVFQFGSQGAALLTLVIQMLIGLSLFIRLIRVE